MSSEEAFIQNRPAAFFLFVLFTCYALFFEFGF